MACRAEAEGERERRIPLPWQQELPQVRNTGFRWVAVAGSPQPTHAVGVAAQLDRAVASLAAHRTYLAALSDEPPEQHARTFIEHMAASVSARFAAHPAVAFELISR